MFYVKDVFGLKVDSERKIDMVRKSLMEAIVGEAAKPKKENAEEEEKD